MGAHVVSVNIGTPVHASWAGSVGSTAIKKHSVVGPVAVHTLGVEGDRIADTKHHGGIHQAVYAFAQEDLDVWAERLDQPVPPGMFGENLTTAGLDVNEAVLGSHWRIGTVLLQPIEVRIPCSVFKGWLGRSGYDDAQWVRRFTAEARPGPYLRVLETGTLQAGDAIVVEHVPDHEVTVSTMFKAFTTDRSLLPELARVTGLQERAYAAVRAYAGRTH